MSMWTLCGTWNHKNRRFAQETQNSQKKKQQEEEQSQNTSIKVCSAFTHVCVRHFFFSTDPVRKARISISKKKKHKKNRTESCVHLQSHTHFATSVMFLFLFSFLYCSIIAVCLVFDQFPSQASTRSDILRFWIWAITVAVSPLWLSITMKLYIFLCNETFSRWFRVISQEKLQQI